MINYVIIVESTFQKYSFLNVIYLKSYNTIETVKEAFIIASSYIIEKADKFINENNFDDSEKKLIKLQTSENISLKRYLIDELLFQM